MINQVAAGKLDYGFVIGKPENPELETKLLFHQPLAIYVPKGHPLEYKEAVTFSDLQGEPFLTMNEHYHIFDMVQEGCRAAGFEPDIRARVVEGQTLITLVEAGQGVAFLPQFLEGLPESVCAVSFDPDVTWDIWGIQRADSEDQELFENIDAMVHEQVEHALDTNDKNERDARLRPIIDAAHETFDAVCGEETGMIDEILYLIQFFFCTEKLYIVPQYLPWYSLLVLCFLVYQLLLYKL